MSPPAAEPASLSGAGEGSSAVLLRGLRIAVLAICATVLVLQGALRMMWHLDRDRWPAGQVSVYLISVVIVAIGVFLVVTDRSWGAWRWPTGCVLLTSTVVSWVSLPPVPGSADWHFGLLGWLILVVFFDAPLLTMAGLIAGHVSLSAVLAVVVTDLDRADLLALANVTVEIVGLQLAVAAGTIALRRVAQTADAAARREEELVIGERVSAQLHADRVARDRELDTAVRPLLASLAAGELDPADPAVRLQCAVEAARMRRMFSESDDAPDPLMNELQAAADVAVRRGIVVSIDSSGATPPLPRRVRRALIDPVVPVLVKARRTARVTVTGTADTVAVSVVSDVTPEDSHTRPGPGGPASPVLRRTRVPVAGRDPAPVGIDPSSAIHVTTLQEGGTSWVQSRWTGN